MQAAPGLKALESPGGIEVFGMKGKALLARSLSSQMEGL